MRVTVSRQADADLDDILDYSLAAHGRETAESYLRTINATFDRIAGYPEIGMARSELGAVQSVPVGQHRIFYEIVSDEILILRVLHKAMDVERHL